MITFVATDAGALREWVASSPALDVVEERAHQLAQLDHLSEAAREWEALRPFQDDPVAMSWAQLQVRRARTGNHSAENGQLLARLAVAACLPLEEVGPGLDLHLAQGGCLHFLVEHAWEVLHG